MRSRVGRQPRRNPFAAQRIQPGAIPYVFPEDDAIPALIGRLRGLGRGQIVGPQGSGKSTLLAALLPHLRHGWDVYPFTLRWRQRRLPAEVWATPPGPTLLVIDGYEQLRFWTRWRLQGHCLRRGIHLLVTTHQSLGLPTLYRTGVSAELAGHLVGTLLTEEQRRLLGDLSLAERLRRQGGNFREVLFELYDLYEKKTDP
jgi:hypothetical protein